MRFGVLSDLHIDVNHDFIPARSSFVKIIDNLLEEKEIDVLLLAGDISNDYQNSLEFLTELSEATKAKVLFVPGNHDYWSKDNGVADTKKIYEAFKEWNGCIAEQPYQVDSEWVVIGNSGWYDHSFGSSQFSNAEFEKMHYMDRTWQDSIYTDWGMRNKDIHQFFYQKIEHDLKQHRGKKIIMMTHMLTHQNFTVPMPNEKWAYFNAFLGSKNYFNLYEKYGVQFGIMGHVHYRKTDNTSHTQMICACLGNNNEWKTNELETEIRDAFFSFEV
ncbi:metallophosphoesterase [Bacillaceae bacterium S4-13-58]